VCEAAHFGPLRVDKFIGEETKRMLFFHVDAALRTASRMSAVLDIWITLGSYESALMTCSFREWEGSE
jgi:hypothetical protein